ncbi:rhomboid-related protein 4 [Marchantia polymorpha subsp. ruderalis]|uniref:RanBP2-type domain-containing protein n=2 Tax=Marchantia polymorpha TaxID=3197 RepID=A0AAF6ATT6_MARPO|nr:hypothetical protein MARPO_0061s0084 [Marchantia polymorpha]BBM99856.1 hypothetical protein Mp_1g24370 [Marchantia polymorpha subsp. ruderalis]|eukprot:PTQ36829.1 hypothetical protein MARPO_0061s0084 [Marchantia polymorpha]
MIRGRNRRVGGGNGMLYMLALHAASQFMQLPRKPPVTATLILANTIVHLRPGVLDLVLPTVQEVCLNPYRVLKDWDARRLLLSAFYHVDDAHLVYNMISLLWKGVQLEGSMGSKKFAGMVGVLLGLSHGLVVVSAKFLYSFADNPGPMYSECAVGFSAVLFALKMVLNWNSPDYTNVYGVLIPSRYAAWAELFFIQMFVPGTSFLGHLCGVVAGLIYINGSFLLSGTRAPVGWVKKVLQRPISLLLWPFTRFGNSSRRGRTYGRGLARGATGVWRCLVCTYDNRSTSHECDMCGAPRGSAREHSVGETEPSAPPWPEEDFDASPPTIEDLRRARLARFNNRAR